MQRCGWMILTMTAGLALFTGCGGSQDGGEAAAGGSASTTETPAAEATETPGAEGALAGLEEYRSEHDPDAVYTYDDIPGRGNYVRVNFEGLTDEQVNRVVHRLRTEQCNCLDCEKSGLTLDECLVGRPDCHTSEKLATQIVSEEKRRADSGM